MMNTKSNATYSLSPLSQKYYPNREWTLGREVDWLDYGTDGAPILWAHSGDYGQMASWPWELNTFNQAVRVFNHGFEL